MTTFVRHSISYNFAVESLVVLELNKKFSYWFQNCGTYPSVDFRKILKYVSNKNFSLSYPKDFIKFYSILHSGQRKIVDFVNYRYLLFNGNFLVAYGKRRKLPLIAAHLRFSFSRIWILSIAVHQQQQQQQHAF